MTGYDHLLADTIWFTAARDMDESDFSRIVIPVLDSLPRVGRYVTGGARGGDALIGRWLALTRPAAEHVIVVPANRSQVEPWWLELGGSTANAWPTLIEMPDGTTYADRNERGVEEGDATVGFPAYPETSHRSLRSGTWQTIQIAQRNGTLSQWHCVKPPHTYQIEKYIETRHAG